MSEDNDWENLNVDQLKIISEGPVLENEFVSNTMAISANLTSAMMDVLNNPREHPNIIKVENYILRFAQSRLVIC